MTQYFFILGRNPELSRAELYSYLESEKIEAKEILFKENFLILELVQEVRFNIQDFGGLMKLGKLLFRGNYTDLNKFVQKNEIIPADKFTYSVLGNFEELEDWLIDKFKSEKKRAMIRRGLQKKLKTQEGDFFNMTKADFDVFCFFQNELFLGLAEQNYQHKDIKERDMKKPVRRESLAISPRLAKILINLSQARPNELMLDPFCGIGGVLQEALLKEINVYGVDKDPSAISNAEKNLKWLQKNYKLKSTFKLETADSKNAPNKNFDAIATETPLGDIFRKRPKDFQARELIQKFENSLIQVLRRIHNIKKKEAKIALTLPFIRNFSVNVQHICNETGLKVHTIQGISTNKNISFPIKEFREDQFISREILVLE